MPPQSTPAAEPGAFVVVANRLPVELAGEERESLWGGSELPVTETGTLDLNAVIDLTDRDATALSWRRSPGGLVTALEPILADRGGTWVGWPGIAGIALGSFSWQGLNLEPVALSALDVTEYYEGFSNGTLWPLYHDVIAPPAFHRSWWRRYREVNRRFAERAAACVTAGGAVWVHDYQLQLVPAMLRELRPDVVIGYFHHIPFPGFNLFAQLPWRSQVIEGLLGADVVGFQRANDVENFRTAVARLTEYRLFGATVQVSGASRRPPATIGPSPTTTLPGSGARGPGRCGGSGRLELDAGDGDRRVLVRAYPISIDTAAFERIADQSGREARAMRERLGDPGVLLLGVDRLDYTKGIVHRLVAISELLAEGQLDPTEVVFVQVASPSREQVGAYQQMRDEIELIVGRINGEYSTLGHQPVRYLHQSFPRNDMAALYRAADVMLVTALRDGMNLVAKEFVAATVDDDGVLVLSEFTGAADELREALLVNPHDIEALKSAIVRAVTMPPIERVRRMRALRRRVRENTVADWARHIVQALTGTPSPHDGIDAELRRALAEVARAERLVVSTDFDGTLARLVDEPAEATLEPGAQLALARLARLAGVDVAVISGRSLASLTQVAPSLSEVAILVGSHGAEWGTGLDPGSLTPRERGLLAELGSYLADAIRGREGVRLERKPVSLAVHTRRAEAAVAERALAELGDAVLRRWPALRARRGKDVLEFVVRPASKLTALERLTASEQPVRRVFIGDDDTDEEIFAGLQPHDVGIKVGTGRSFAEYRVASPADVVRVLGLLAAEREEVTL